MSDDNKLDLRKRLEDLDERRLAQLPDHDLVSVIAQRKHFAHLQFEDKWKKQSAGRGYHKLRFKR